MRRNAVVDRARELVAIYRQRRAARNARLVRRLQYHRAEHTHFRLQQAMCVGRLRALESVRADQFCQAVGFVRGGRAYRSHLVDDNVVTALSELARCFASRESATNDTDLHPSTYNGVMRYHTATLCSVRGHRVR